MAWLLVLVAGVFETGFVVLMRRARWPPSPSEPGYRSTGSPSMRPH